MGEAKRRKELKLEAQAPKRKSSTAAEREAFVAGMTGMSMTGVVAALLGMKYNNRKKE